MTKLTTRMKFAKMRRDYQVRQNLNRPTIQIRTQQNGHLPTVDSRPLPFGSRHVALRDPMSARMVTLW